MDKKIKNDCINCGIKCSAQNCVHHTEDDCCVVDTVRIGTRTAKNCDETICASFKCNK